MCATCIIQWRDCGRVPWEDKWEELSAELMVLVSFYSTLQLKVLSFCLGQNNFNVLCQSPCERVCPSRYPRILSLCTARLSTSVPSVPGNRLGWTELCISICQSCKHTHTDTISHIHRPLAPSGFSKFRVWGQNVYNSREEMFLRAWNLKLKCISIESTQIKHTNTHLLCKQRCIESFLYSTFGAV